MPRDVLRRTRWANVALACVVLTALVTVVVWPLVSSSTPRLPPDASRPLVTAGSDQREGGPGGPARGRAAEARAERPGAEQRRGDRRGAERRRADATKGEAERRRA